MIKNKKRLIINVLIILTIILGIRLYIDNNIFEVSYINFIDEEVPDSFNNVKILHISDLHNKSYGKENAYLLEAIENISPDYIFLTGDMVSSKDEDFTIFFNLAREIGKKYSCYYILGNHEMDLTNAQRENIYNTLEKNNIIVLDNEMVTLSRKENEINLYGMWYNAKYYIKEDFYIENMKKILGNAKPGFNILLTHNPDDFEAYSSWGADLTFSGHVHGGMIRLPFIGGLFSPNRSLFPTYDAGLYKSNDSSLIVSRGMSRGATGIRLFNKPELLVVTLNSSNL